MDPYTEINYNAACENVDGRNIWQAFARSGQIIEAIKKVRELTGLGLLDAKNVVHQFRNIVMATPIKVESVIVGSYDVTVKTFPDGSFKTEIVAVKDHQSMASLVEYLFSLH